MTEPAIARSDSMSPKDSKAVLTLLAARAAKSGNYGLHSDLTGVVECIDALLEQLEYQREASAELARQVRANVESMRKGPR